MFRLMNNQNPFQAGQDHIHHLFFHKTKSIFATNFYLFIKYNFFIIGYFSFLTINTLSSFTLYFIFIFIIFFLLRYKYSKKNYKIKN